MRILVTRPEPDNARTAAALQARGHTPLLAPLLRVVPVGAALPTLRHGTRVEARIALAPAPLFDQIWRRTRQTLQRRLAV